MRLALLIATIVLFQSCASSLRKSRLEDFNAKSSALALTIKGEVERTRFTPDQVEMIELWNRAERYIRHNAQLDDDKLYEYIGGIADGSPNNPPEDYRLDTSIEGTIRAQLKYAIRVDDQKIPLAIEPGTLEYQVDGPVIRYSIDITLNPTRPTVTARVRETPFLFPRRPFDVFFRINPWDAIKDILKTRKQSKSALCHEADGDPIAPHSYFYYLNPHKNPACLASYGEEFVEFRKVSLSERPPTTVWPEYDQLFKDGRLDIVVVFGPGHVPLGRPLGPINHRTFRTFLRKNRYRKTKTLKENDEVFTKERQDGLTISVRTLLVKDKSLVSEQLQNESGYSNELIFYSGHSDYGAALNDAFGSKGFPEERYQIIGLFSCNSYEYGKSSVLASKAIVDFDPSYLYVDLLSTAHALMFRSMVPTITEALVFFEEAYEEFANKRGMDHYDYLSLLRRLDSRDAKGEDAAVFTVAGEVQNRFAPPGKERALGGSTGPSSKSLKAFLKELIASTDSDENTKSGFAKSAIKKHGVDAIQPLFGLLSNPSQVVRNAVLRGVYNAELTYPESFNSALTDTIESGEQLELEWYYSVLNRYFHETAEIEDLFVRSIRGELGPERQKDALSGIYNAEKTTPRILTAMIELASPKAPDQLFSALKFTFNDHTDLYPDIMKKLLKFTPSESRKFYQKTLPVGVEVQRQLRSPEYHANLLEFFNADENLPYSLTLVAQHLETIDISPHEAMALREKLLSSIRNNSTAVWHAGTLLALFAKLFPDEANVVEPSLIRLAGRVEDNIDRRILIKAIKRFDDGPVKFRRLLKRLAV